MTELELLLGRQVYDPGYENGEYVQHRDGTWGWVRGYSAEGLVIIEEETPSGKPVASENGIHNLFKTPETSIVACDRSKNRTFCGLVEIKVSQYTVADLQSGARGSRGGL